MDIKKEVETVRFTITVDKDAYDILERYCELMEVTKSTVLNSWLATSSGAMNSLLDVVERAKSGEISLTDLQAELDRFTGILDAVEASRK